MLGKLRHFRRAQHGAKNRYLIDWSLTVTVRLNTPDGRPVISGPSYSGGCRIPGA